MTASIWISQLSLQKQWEETIGRYLEFVGNLFFTKLNIQSCCKQPVNNIPPLPSSLICYVILWTPWSFLALLLKSIHQTWTCFHKVTYSPTLEISIQCYKDYIRVLLWGLKMSNCFSWPSNPVWITASWSVVVHPVHMAYILRKDKSFEWLS